MFSKKIASVYFSANAVYAVELDTKRRKVLKAASFELPQELYSNNRISDKSKVSTIIKEFWSKNNFRSRDVGIVIPEFSTFTKLITLPKLNISEIGEAVSWQAQEYLPTGIEDMVLDWKVLGRNDLHTEVMMVAVKKAVLLEYVQICVNAGLFPVAVETPSVALGNIVENSEGYIIIVNDSVETLIISGEKSKILSSSVVTNGSHSEILASITRVIKHFPNITFKSLYLGGVGISSELVENLKSSLKVAITPLDPRVKGLEQSELQKHLIPISLLKTQISEPSSPNTLNLLPANLVGKYQNQKVRTQVWSLTLTVTVFVWVSLLIVLGSYMVLTQQISAINLENQANSSLIQERKTAETKVKNINTVVGNVIAIKKSSIYPQDILNKIFLSKPVGVNLTSYEMDLDSGEVKLRGISADRVSLVEFKDRLEVYDEINSVNIPISSFEEVINLEFSLSFEYLVGGQTSASMNNTK